MVKIAPSLLAADSACLGKAVSDLEASGADFIHFDVMDGHFVPNLTFGPKILQELKKHTSLPFDVHLMVTNPDECISWYADAGADLITFHLETTQNPLQTLKLIKDRHIKSGITLKPSSNIEQIIPFIDDIDFPVDTKDLLIVLFALDILADVTVDLSLNELNPFIKLPK